jgi:hypothetical protein
MAVDVNLENRLSTEAHYIVDNRVRLYRIVKEMQSELHVASNLHGSDLVAVDSYDLEMLLEWAERKLAPKKRNSLKG